MLEIKNITKVYKTKGAPDVRALDGVSVKFEKTGMVFVLGKSGSGKSTFLNVVGGLDSYDSGEIIIKDKSSEDFRASDFDSYRNTYLGFVFQEYNIIEEFTIARNIGLALELQHRKAAKEDIDKILDEVDLKGYGDRYPNQISGGQKQRVAIARALIKDPEIIFADEPTGALDSKTGAAIFDTLRKLAQTKLVMVVSHDREYAEIYGDRIIEFKDGKIISDMVKTEEGFSEQIKNVDGAIVLDNAIKIPAGTKLTKEVASAIQAMLSSATGDVIISCDSHLNKELVDAFDPAKKRKKFVATSEDKLDFTKPYSPFKLIKSKLPTRQAAKMARSSMNHKKGRLVFSIILAVLAVTFFGFSNVVGAFSEKTVVASAMNEFGYKHIVVNKQVAKSSILSFGGTNVAFSESEEASIAQLTDGGYGTYYNFSDSLPLKESQPDSEYSQSYFNTSFAGLVLSDNLDKLGLDVPLAYGRMPNKYDEILITNYTAEHFMAYGLIYVHNGVEESIKPTKINDILSYTIKLSSARIPLKIVGIINFNIERYKDLKLTSTEASASKLLKDEFNERKNFEISMLYGLPSLINHISVHNYSYIDAAAATFNIAGLENRVKSNNSYCFSTIMRLDDAKYRTNTVFIDTQGQTKSVSSLNDDEVIINVSKVLSMIDIMQNGYDWSKGGMGYDLPAVSAAELWQKAQSLGLDDPSFRLSADFFLSSLFHYDGAYYKLGELNDLKVVGFYTGDAYITDGSNGLAIVSDANYEKIARSLVGQSLFCYLMDGASVDSFGRSFIGSFDIQNSGGAQITFGYTMPFSAMISMLVSMFTLMSMVFFYMSLGFCFFAALLLLNFISTSVIYKRKEIGILRAIGARKNDVMSIFLLEGFYIALYILIFSLLFVTAAVVVFNNLIVSLIGLPLTMLYVDIMHIVYMMAVCFATVTVASILPVSRVASMRPIDAIRGK